MASMIFALMFYLLIYLTIVYLFIDHQIKVINYSFVRIRGRSSKTHGGMCRIKVACLILLLNRREGRGEGEKGSQRRREGKEEEGKRKVEEEEELLSKF